MIRKDSQTVYIVYVAQSASDPLRPIKKVFYTLKSAQQYVNWFESWCLLPNGDITIRRQDLGRIK